MSKKHHSKPYAFDESEKSWSGFIYDRDCCSEIVRAFFPRGVITKHKRNDPATVLEAKEAIRTIITSNGDDFIRYIGASQRVDNRKTCADSWGMIWLPNGDRDRDNALSRLGIEHGIKLDGRLVPWSTLGYLNLCVHVLRDGRLNLMRFRRCKFCEERTPIKEKWFQLLSFVRVSRAGT
jgi:hypothetical protein